MHSPAYNKAVFIDYGLSRFVEEEIGMKTASEFVGNAEHCSPEMKKSLNL